MTKHELIKMMGDEDKANWAMDRILESVKPDFVLMEKNERYWCWWMSRYLWLVSARNGQYVFEDAGDVRFTLTEEQVAKLERR